MAYLFVKNVPPDKKHFPEIIQLYWYILAKKQYFLIRIQINSIKGVPSEKLSKKADKKNVGKKGQKEILKSQKESEMKDSILRDERLRLHNEALRSHNVSYPCWPEKLENV